MIAFFNNSLLLCVLRQTFQKHNIVNSKSGNQKAKASEIDLLCLHKYVENT